MSNNLVSVNLSTLFKMDIPKPKMIVSPIISGESLSMIYASRGIGKTHLSLEIAYCVAHGIDMFNGKWKVEKPKKVLFVDGEMPLGSLRDRLISVHNRYHKILSHDLNNNLSIFSNVLQGEVFSLIDITNKNIQQSLTSKFDGVDLVILDNLSSLTFSGKENEADSYSNILSWLLYLRHKKISVLIIHHAGKNGEQRGTSRREDALDTVLNLTKISNSEDGCAFRVNFAKHRHFYGDEAKSFEVKLSESGWQILNENLVDELDKKDKAIVDSISQGLARKEICEQIGIAKSALSKRISKLKEMGCFEVENAKDFQGFSSCQISI